uniref:VPS10 domain-containing protein n=1 Tax=Electrophorus electricus TaxID=8005 RepID=A0A4W4F5V4_ELEEL
AINNSFIRKDFGIGVGPGNSQQVCNSNICMSCFTKESNVLEALKHGINFISRENFMTLILTTSLLQSEADKRGELLLRRTQDLGRTFTTIAQNIFTFGYIGRFLFTSVMEKQVGKNKGDIHRSTLLSMSLSLSHPNVSTLCFQFYSVLDGDEDMIFMHVDSPGDQSYFGTVYTSDDRGILYSKSLERHLFGGESKSDFTNVTSLRGVYLTNILKEDERICSVISFNKGGEWRSIKKPNNVECGGSTKRVSRLLSAWLFVGESISASRPDVYVSSDGGYNWMCALRGPHHYSILDSGGLIVAVEAHRDRQVQSIKFSTDEGQCWKTYNFTQQPIFFAGLASEPGSKAMNISVFGYRPDDDAQPMWVAVTIDFEQLVTRECDEQDYVEWLAHSDEDGAFETDGCVLGYKEKFRKLKKLSVCRNGWDYVVSKQQSPCPCTLSLYDSDYGYYRHENSSECVKQPDLPDKTLELCLNGEMKELQTAGYRKIPSDKCEGGFSPPRQMDVAKKNCTTSESTGVLEQSDTLLPQAHCLHSALSRATAYRFSALQLKEEEQCASPESRPSSNPGSFHEDSDDASLTFIYKLYFIFILNKNKHQQQQKNKVNCNIRNK